MDCIIVNGEKQSHKNIKLDSGFFFGKGVFETIHVCEKPIFLEEHLNRINYGMKVLGINKEVLKEEVLSNISLLKCKNKALKIMVSEENTIYSCRDIPYTVQDYKNGFSLKVSDVKRNPYSNMTYIKSFNYCDNILEREEALKEGYNEVLFLNVHDKIAEGSISNIFFIKDNVIYTPKVQCGLLKGIVRDYLISEIEHDGKFCIEQGEFELKELYDADGIFLTNSLLGVIKVKRINDVEIKESAITDYIEFLYKKSILYK